MSGGAEQSPAQPPEPTGGRKPYVSPFRDPEGPPVQDGRGSPAARELRRARAALARRTRAERARAEAHTEGTPPTPAPRLEPRPADPRAAARAWFAAHGWEPFAFQEEVWDAYLAGESGLVHAATGTGKTYAAWLGPLIEWLGDYPDSRPEQPPPALRVLWVTPLRALAADTEAALRIAAGELGLPWTVEARTGDTPEAQRARQRRRLPTALVTTPESLSLLLTRPDAAELFEDLQLVVVDEWHELMASKRGVQVELCLARLRRFRPGLRTWGLSATLGNLDEARDALLGAGPERPGRLVRGLVPKALEIDALIPPVIDRFPWSGQIGLALLGEVLDAVDASDSALVFTNTRATAEIWYQALRAAAPRWAGRLALHHGSLDRAARDAVELGLHEGTLRCVVCTSTLDLGVDFSPVDRVLQVGSPKGVARLVQRAGRSGHRPGAVSRVTCVPASALELVEVAAARDALAAGAIERRPPLERPLDLLAQHLVTVAVGGGFVADELLAEVRTTHAYRGLTDDEWRWTLDFVARGGDALRAYPEYAKLVERDGRWVVASPQVALRHRLSIGTIVSDAQLTVKYLRGAKVGTVEESFLARLKPGDRFVLGGKVLEFVRIRDLTAWVRRARGDASGAVPKWSGARLPLSPELAEAVRRRIGAARGGAYRGPEMEAVRPVLELQREWSALPAADELLVERTRTRDGHHLFFYPIEGRLVHEGLAALFAYRIAQLAPISFTFAANDWGFELLSPDPAPLDEALDAGLLSAEHLGHDVPASLNAAELARRQFREIARIAGLVFQGWPGRGRDARQLQASSGLIYDVFARYDPDNLLLRQAHREVLERQLEQSRLGRALARLSAGRVTVTTTARPTPFAFALLVDRAREQVSSEKLADRVRRMAAPLERAARR
jgi:ATP-dependent Lhr-like helicase